MQNSGWRPFPVQGQAGQKGVQQAHLLLSRSSQSNQPLRFTTSDFKRLPYDAIWHINPGLTAEVMQTFTEWGRMSKWNNNPGDDPRVYVSETVIILHAIEQTIAEMVRRRKRKSKEVCYLVQRLANKPPWGNFCRLTRFLMEEPLELKLPLTLPQCLLNVSLDGYRPVREEITPMYK